MPLWTPSGRSLAAPSATALGAAPAGAAPATAIAQTIPWWFVTSSTVAVASGTLYLHAVTLPAGVPVSNITWTIGSTGGLTLTHGWYALVNTALLQVAHTADQTSGNMANAADNTKALVTPYVPPVTAQDFLGICVVASPQPTIVGSGGTQGGSMFTAHPSSGSSSTGLTTPGTDGTTTYGAMSATAPMYGYAS